MIVGFVFILSLGSPFVPLSYGEITLSQPEKLVIEKFVTEKELFNNAGFLRDSGKFDESYGEYEKLIRNFPDGVFIADATYYLAVVSLKAGQIDESRKLFSRFVEYYPAHFLANKAKVFLDDIAKGQGSLHAEVLSHKKLEKSPPLNAVQVLVFDGKSLKEIREELELVKKGGANTIILRVFHNSGDRLYGVKLKGKKGGFYFETSEGPVLYDLLGPVIKIARQYDLKVFAWMTTRYADYGVEHRGDFKCKAYDFEKDALTYCKGMDIFNSQVIKRLVAIYSDLADYDIDGVLFQDDLVLRHNEGFGRSANIDFFKSTGRELNPKDFYIISPISHGKKTASAYTSLFWQWSVYKNQRLMELAVKLKQAVQEKRPDTKFALNLMYESLTDPVNALAWLSQDLTVAVDMGFDYFSVMAYHRQMAKELNKSLPEVTMMIEQMVSDAVRIVGSKEKVLIKLQTKDWKTGEKIGHNELSSIVRAVKAVDKDVSLALVPYRPGLSLNDLLYDGETASLVKVTGGKVN